MRVFINNIEVTPFVGEVQFNRDNKDEQIFLPQSQVSITLTTEVPQEFVDYLLRSFRKPYTGYWTSPLSTDSVEAVLRGVVQNNQTRETTIFHVYYTRVLTDYSGSVHTYEFYCDPMPNVPDGVIQYNGVPVKLYQWEGAK